MYIAPNDAKHSCLNLEEKSTFIRNILMTSHGVEHSLGDLSNSVNMYMGSFDEIYTSVVFDETLTLQSSI